jgi:Flp pilus assembly protein TadB
VSRRSRRERRPAAPQRTTEAPAPSSERMGLAAQLGIALGVFAAVTLIAELAGAANLGVALGVGQIAFAITVVWLMVWR